MALCGVLTLGSVAGYSSTVQAATVQQQFQDTRTSYAKDAITHLVTKGIAAGTSETTFEPKKSRYSCRVCDVCGEIARFEAR